MSRAPATDVLVVGGGPAGHSAAIHLARAGHGVTLLERRRGAWSGARGDLHVPMAVGELTELGVDLDAAGAHRIRGARTWWRDRCVDLTWPMVDDASAMVVPRAALERQLVDVSRSVGVDVRQGAEALAPIVARGFVRGATVTIRTPSDAEPSDAEPSDAEPSDLELFDTEPSDAEPSDIGTSDIGTSDAEAVPVTRDPVAATGGGDEEIRCRFLVIADGARSRFGRALGTHREQRWPYALTAASYFVSDRHDDTALDTVLAPSGPDGAPVTGHAWVHPMGDGRVSVGVNVLSSHRDVVGLNVLKFHQTFVESIAERWGLDPSRPLTDPARVRTPLGGSVAPTMGPTFLVAGDAAGVANPFNGHGTGAALVTGRICAEVLDEALTVGNSTTLQRYPVRLAEELGEYHKVARLSVRFLGRPWLLTSSLGLAMRSEQAMGAALRVSAGQLRATDPAGAERAYRLAALAARFAPSW